MAQLTRRINGRLLVLLAALLVVAVTGTATAAARHHAGPASGEPSLGPNVVVFTPSMPQSEIQSRLDAIATQQVSNQFGAQRYAILFEPGTYGSAADPLSFQVGYYTQVAGLGARPGDVIVNGAIDVFNQCSSSALSSCSALNNFWRSVSNLTIDFTKSSHPSFTPANGENSGCQDSNEMWAVSQAAPMRRVVVNGTTTLQDYCGRGFASGGFLADDTFNAGTVINGGQQQFFTRNSNLDGWTNSVWNQVFLGDNGAPATKFDGSTQYTTLPSAPVSEEQPFLYRDTAGGGLRVFVPAVRRNSVGPDYAGGAAAGSSLPIDRFFIADPSTPVRQINAALAHGRDLILQPGVYQLDHAITVKRADTIVIGLGFATLSPQRGEVAMRTADVPGVKLSGIIFDAGAQGSPALLEVGRSGHGHDGHDNRQGGHRDQHPADPADPTLLSDVFFRIGGAQPGRATGALVVNVDRAILDDVWAWRADHGAGAGWTTNPADTGVVVNGDNVSAYGLAVEHFQKDEVSWNGQHGLDVFFQNEMPYDPPSQAAWMSDPTTEGYPAFRVAPGVTSFDGYGMGSYSFFNQGVPIFADEAFASSTTPGVRFHDLLTIFLDASHGSGGIRSVIDGVGGSSTAANPDKPVDVVSYP